MQVKIGERIVGDADVVKHLRLSGDWEDHTRALCAQEVVHALAAARGVTVSDEELQVACDVFRKLRGLHKAEDTRRWLVRSGLVLEDLERDREAALLQQKLAAEVPAEEVERAFAARREALDEVRASLIARSDEGEAQEIAARARAGADFGELALERSEDESAARFGALGWVRRGALADEVAARLFAARSGEVVGPVRVGGRSLIYRLHELRRAELTPEVEGELRDELVAEAGLRLYREELLDTAVA
ncbi:MAG: peptidylprolyl isomerase [Planctomycetota bacterium]